jgi:porphobilinogen deaminase
MTTKSTVIIKDIPPDLKHAFKIACAIEGISQRDAMITLMKEWVEKKEEKNEP